MTKNQNQAPQPWQKIRSEAGPDLPLFRARYDWMENPRNQKALRRLVLESANWVNIVAVTPEKQVVIIRQYRFGSGQVATEIPGGLVDPGEDSLTAAQRELREETGFTSPNWHYLGSVDPNPAYLENVCHQWLALEAVKTDEVEMDEGEDIVVTTLSLNELRAEIKTGQIRHSLALLSLSKVFNIWGTRDGDALSTWTETPHS